MDKLKERILKEGVAIGSDRINVDGFINHRIDTAFMDEIGQEFAKRFRDVQVDKILTVEASGIAIACAAAPCFNYAPVVFAKKAAPSTMNEGFYEAEAKSFTKGTVSKLKVAEKFINKGEKILILDDFLASGEASVALAQIVEMAGAEVAGIGAVIEKGFQGGSDRLRAMGYRVESLAVIEKIDDGVITFK